MHFSVLVVVPTKDVEEDLNAAVEKALAPFNENDPAEEDGGRWDWWQIGGRWTGMLDDYDPESDPDNSEPCEWCETTGTVTEAVGKKYPAWKVRVGQKCPQCDGKGRKVSWPTQWKQYSGDVITVPAYLKLLQETQRVLPYALVMPTEGGGFFWMSKEEVDGIPGTESTLTERVNSEDWSVVVVDCHC